MTTMSVTDFKAHCLGVLSRIQDEPEDILLTKHGHVVAKVVPVLPDDERPWESLRGTAHFTEANLFSDDDVWEEST